MGVFEIEPFAAGTARSPRPSPTCGGTTVVGGGDSVAAPSRRSASPTSITHVSTGGGASLELLEGRTLPGVARHPAERRSR